MSQYLGNVSAYAYAVEKGYTGTEEEFAELMASYATVGQTAVDAAESALNSKTAAQTAATTATNKASEATTAATTATTKASEASQSAQTASTKASEASQSAQTASTKASEASQSASTASQKASQASQSASQALTYKTAAESAKTASQTAQGLAEQAQTAAETAQGLAEDARDLAQQYAESIDPEHIFSAYPTDTASGAVASFADGADDIPLKSLVVNIDPVQSGSGDPSPDNVRPITGWTGVNVKRMGVNLWDEEWESGTLDISTGEKVNSNVTMRSKNFIPVKPRMKCIAVGPHNVVNTNQFIICCYDKDEVYVGYRTLTRPGSFEVPSDGRIALMRFAYRYYLNDSGDVYNHDVSVNYPSTATAYAPYSSTTYPISFPSSAGTVYGGSLDVLSGVLTVYPYYASYNGETLTGRWISDRDVYAVGTTPTIGAQVVNIGAEGTEIQLDAHTINSLLGQNNIFADTGDSSAEYRADTKMYIERPTEPDADMIADANIVSGQYFMVGNSLYLATSNIASGGQVIEGTNAIRKSLSEALNEINQ